MQTTKFFIITLILSLFIVSCANNNANFKTKGEIMLDFQMEGKS